MCKQPCFCTLLITAHEIVSVVKHTGNGVLCCQPGEAAHLCNTGLVVLQQAVSLTGEAVLLSAGSGVLHACQGCQQSIAHLLRLLLAPARKPYTLLNNGTCNFSGSQSDCAMLDASHWTVRADLALMNICTLWRLQLYSARPMPLHTHIQPCKDACCSIALASFCFGQ